MNALSISALSNVVGGGAGYGHGKGGHNGSKKS